MYLLFLVKRTNYVCQNKLAVSIKYTYCSSQNILAVYGKIYLLLSI